jgi:hypothetical protein
MTVQSPNNNPRCHGCIPEPVIFPELPALERLKRTDQLVAWRYHNKGDGKKLAKVPVNPRTGGNASVTDPNTWGTHAEAELCAQRKALAGIGYVLTDDDNLTGGDLDNVRDKTTGKLEPWAADIVALNETYCEVSPSGCGLRLFWQGKIAATIKNDQASVELYPNGRFLTITGNHVAGTPISILPAPKTEAALRRRVRLQQDAGKGVADHTRDPETPWQALNTAALAKLDAWVPELFGGKAKKTAAGVYRVSSADLGRELEEDLSIAPQGIKDFGIHDMGDARQGKRTPIDLVVEYGKKSSEDAVAWLGEKLGLKQPPPKKDAITATPWSWVDPKSIPRRQWLYHPMYIRAFTSQTISTGGIGKSSLIIAEMLAMAVGRALLGVMPKAKLRVWYWNGEDPSEELNRRIAAAAKHYGLTAQDIGDRLFVDSGRTMPMVIAKELKREGTWIYEPVIDQIITTIKEQKIDVMIVDPFVSCHRVNENDNPAIDLVAKSWGRIAESGNCAVMLVHHTRKTSEAKTVDDGRGASALLDAVRVARAINSMTAKEAEDAEIEVNKRRWYFRADNGKINLTPPAEQATWYKLVSVDLENAGPGDDWDQSDKVGVVTAWNYPAVAMPNITADEAARVLAAIKSGGPWRADPRSKSWVGCAIAQALGLDLERRTHRRAVAKLADDWERNGLLIRVTGQDSQRHEREFIEVPASVD